jgi:hypothetical protein
MKKVSMNLILIVVMLLTIPAVSVADYVDYTGYDGRSINFTYTGTRPSSGGIAAEISIKWNNLPTWAYCIDLDNYLSDNSAIAYYGGVGAPIITADQFKKASWLLEKNWAPGLSSTQRAALQAAIWEVRYDALFTLGNNSAITGFDGYYSTYIASLSDSGFAGFNPTNYVYLDLGEVPGQTAPDTVQDLITRVPEPGTMILFGLGLIGLAGLRRKE